MILTQLFVEIDDFMKEFEPEMIKTMIEDGSKKRNCVSGLSASELMTIVVYFHISGFRTMKKFYIDHIKGTHTTAFPTAVSYKQFVALQKTILLPLTAFMQLKRTGKSTGISFVDSTNIVVCHNRRIHNHKVFNDIAQRGKSSTGWFYGFKLHLIVNEVGDIISFIFTAGNTDDRNPSLMTKLTKNISGKLFGDKGYLSKKLFDMLWKKDIQRDCK